MQRPLPPIRPGSRCERCGMRHIYLGPLSTRVGCPICQVSWEIATRHQRQTRRPLAIGRGR